MKPDLHAKAVTGADREIGIRLPWTGPAGSREATCCGPEAAKDHGLLLDVALLLSPLSVRGEGLFFGTARLRTD